MRVKYFAAALACCLISAVPLSAQNGKPDVSAMWPSEAPRASKSAPAKSVAKPAPKPVAKPEPVKATPAPAPVAPKAETPAEAALVQRLEALEAVARQQSETIAALLSRMTPAPKAEPASQPPAAPKAAAPAPAPAPAPTAAPVAAHPAAVAAPAPAKVPTMETLGRSVDSLKAEISAAEKRAQQRVSGLGNFRFSGDVRLRYEPTFQGGDFVTRHRERSRARLHITGSAGNEFTGGISVTTGASDEPQTENQTLSGFFTRKSIAFERFYVAYKPKWLPGTSFTAGKFAATWARTGLTFSPDLQPEGISASWRSSSKNPTAPEFAVVGFWLPMLEVAGGSDSYIAGGQLQTKWSLDKKTKIQAHAAILDVTGADAIAVAVGAGSLKQSQPQSNTVVKDQAGKVTGYGTSFHLVDGILGLEHAFSAAWPVAVQLNVVKNTRAAQDESLGWFAEARAGANAAAGQTQVSVTFFRIERNAVVGAFNASDLRLGTNSIGQIVSLSHKLRSDITAGFTGWFGRVLDPTKTPGLVAPAFQTACKTAPFDGCRDPRMSRMQFDLTYAF
jgi:putative porin